MRKKGEKGEKGERSSRPATTAPPPDEEQPAAGPSNQSTLNIFEDTPQGETHPVDDVPPGYSEVTPAATAPTPTTWRQRLLATPGLPNVDILQYLPVNGTLSDDLKTVTVADQTLTTDAAALASFFSAQAALPPRPFVRVTGTSVSGVDFDFKIDMMRYFIRPQGQPAWNYVKLVDANEAAFRGEVSQSTKPHVDNIFEWSRKYCKNSASSKAFILERELANWNTGLLEGRLRNLLASLHYNGKISISFAASHTQVLVQPPPTGLFPRFWSLLTATKKYSVIKAVWPYANMSVEERGGARRQCAVQSEEEWWEVWSSVIALAIMKGRKGWVTSEDVLDMAMSLRNQPGLGAGTGRS